MLQKQSRQKDMILWHELLEKEVAYIQTRQYFINNSIDRVSLIKQALHDPSERGTALRLIEYLTLEERQALLDDLVDLTSVSHSDIDLCRKAILSLPTTWLSKNIEKSAEPLLKNGIDEEYRRLLELYLEINKTLAQKLSERALNHKDPNIREVGEDFQNYLEIQLKAKSKDL